MLFKEVIAGCSELHTKHTSTLFRQNVKVCECEAGNYMQ